MLIFPKIDVDVVVSGRTEHVNLEMTENDINDVTTNMARFQNSIEQMSQGKIRINYEMITISEPISTLSYDEENGYYVSASDVIRANTYLCRKKGI